MRLPRRLLALLAVPALGAALTPAGVLAAAHPPPAARAYGVRQYNSRVCGGNWVTVHVPRQSYYRVANDDFGGKTCVTAERHHLDFQIVAASGSGFHAYPDISSGWEAGIYSCTGHRAACYRYPVQVAHDGDPVTSVAGWLAPGRYDFSYDIWTNRTDAHPVQDDGTEVMIWLAHPGITEYPVREVRIDGIEWDVTTWITSHPGEPHWRLLIYYAVHPRSSAYGLRINDFFRDAERNGEMSASYWLTAIDAGFELVSGGVHDNIHEFSLTGVRLRVA